MKKAQQTLMLDMFIVVFVISFIVALCTIPEYIIQLNKAQINQRILAENGVSVSLHEAYWMSNSQFEYLIGGSAIQRSESKINLNISK